jgi:hypothetical protein
MSEMPSYFFPEENITEVRENSHLTRADITNWMFPAGIIMISTFLRL